MSFDESSCLLIAGEEYCNVTIHWEPRISLVGGIFAMIVPTSFALVFVIGTICRIKKEDGVDVVEEVENSYRRNTRLLYIKDHVTREEYEKLKTGELSTIHNVKGHSKYNKFNIDGTKTKLPDPLGDCEFHLPYVTDSHVQTARKHRKLLWGLITLPRPLGYVAMSWKLILQPIVVVVWSVVDVFVDTFYFYQLERGDLIDDRIIRNTHVNNGIMVFAVLGAVAAIYGGYCYSVVLINNEEEATYHNKVIYWSLSAVGIKIIWEDAAELILEYFFVDKFIVENQPWYLVAKDVVAALIYILPLYKLVKSGTKDYRAVSSTTDDGRTLFTYVTFARVTMSVAMVLRVIGMMMQYMGSTIKKECLK